MHRSNVTVEMKGLVFQRVGTCCRWVYICSFAYAADVQVKRNRPLQSTAGVEYDISTRLLASTKNFLRMTFTTRTNQNSRRR
jgi:hypothetical protein